MGDVTVLGELGNELGAILVKEIVAGGLIEGVCDVAVANTDLIVDVATTANDVRDEVEEVKHCAKQLKKA